VAAVRRDDEPKGPKGPIRLRACGIWRMVSAWAHEMWRSGLDDDGQQPWQLGGDTSRGQGGATGRRGRRGEGGGGDGRRAHPSLQLDSDEPRREDLELGSHGDCGDRIGREEPVLGGEEMESEAWCFLW